MLEARDLGFRHAGASRPVFEGLSLTVSPGERLALRAPSGFGKTTLCRLLAGYERPRAGQVLIDGLPLPERGVCPVQLINQHPERVLDPRLRMASSLAEAGEPEGRVLDALGIQKKWLTRHPHELSGGEMQRFCIARALTANPAYLIADEITTMLDAVTQARIWGFLLAEAERRNLGLVFVSHSPALTRRLATRSLDLTDAVRGTR